MDCEIEVFQKNVPVKLQYAHTAETENGSTVKTVTAVIKMHNMRDIRLRMIAPCI